MKEQNLIVEPKENELTSKRFSNRIKISESQTKESLMKHGFTNHSPEFLYFCRMLGNEISFNLSVDIKTLEIVNIYVLDEDFLQPYDYQWMILNGNPPPFALKVYEKVNRILETLQNKGVITGFEKGMYI